MCKELFKRGEGKMSRRRWLTMVSVGVLSLALAAGCGARGNTGTPSAGGGTSAKTKRLTVGIADTVQTLDVQKQGSMGTMSVLSNLYDPLVRRGNDGKLYPALAMEWKALDDHTWQFKLRQGVKFHNGEPFDANAVKFSIERILNPKTKSPIVELRKVDRVDVVDNYTVNIITKQVVPNLPDSLALFGGCIVPSKYIQQQGEEAFAQKPVGTGPFKFKEWQKDDHLTLVANQEYWGGAPRIDELVFRSLPDPADRVAALLSGQVDIINQVPADSQERVKGDPNLRLEKAAGLRLYYLSTAYEQGPTADVRVRQAISYAIDTQALIKHLLNGNGVPAAAPVTQFSFGYDPALKPYEFNPQKAKDLLAQAGYKDGFEIKFQTQPGFYKDLSEAVAGMLEKVGIRAKLEVLPDAQFDELYEKGKLAPLWTNGYTIWQGSPEPLVGVFFKTGMPRAHYHNDQMDRLIATFQGTTDQTKRSGALNAALRMLHDDAAWSYLFVAGDAYGTRKTVKWTPPTNQILFLKDAGIE